MFGEMQGLLLGSGLEKLKGEKLVCAACDRIANGEASSGREQMGKPWQIIMAGFTPLLGTVRRAEGCLG